MRELLKPFLIYCQRECGHTPSTISGYTTCCSSFLAWFANEQGREVTLLDWSESNARAYHSYDKRRGIKQSTRRSRVASMRAWGNWLIANRYVTQNPWLGIKTPVNEALWQPCATAEQVRAMLEACDRIPNRHRGKMAKAAVCLAALCGLRECEVIRVKLADVHVDGTAPFLEVLGKGDKVGQVPLSRQACQILAEWIAVRPVVSIPNLIVLRGKAFGDRPYTAIAFNALLRKLKALALIDPKIDITAHSLRRFCGTAIAQQAGASIADAQAMLRQSHPSTTLRYLKQTRPLTRFVDDILPEEKIAKPAEPVRPRREQPVRRRVRSGRQW